MATLLDPVLFAKAFNPSAMLCPPALVRSAPNPTAVLFAFALFALAEIALDELSVPRVVFPLPSLTIDPFNWLKLIIDIILLHN